MKVNSFNISKTLLIAGFLLAGSSALAQPKSLQADYKQGANFEVKENIVKRTNGHMATVAGDTNTYIDDKKYNYHSFGGSQRGLNFKKLDAYEPKNAKRITEIEPTSSSDYKDGSLAPTLPVGSLQVEHREVKPAQIIQRKTIKVIPEAPKAPANEGWKNPDEYRYGRGGATEDANEPVTGSIFFLKK